MEYLIIVKQVIIHKLVKKNVHKIVMENVILHQEIVKFVKHFGETCNNESTNFLDNFDKTTGICDA